MSLLIISFLPENFGVAFVRFGIYVETIFVLHIAPCLDRFKRRTESFFHEIKKSSTKGVAKISVIEMCNGTPKTAITNATF